MKMRLCTTAVSSIAIALLVLTASSAMQRSSPKATSFTAPAEWNYATHVNGKTYHAKGCKFLPVQNSRAANLIYFGDAREAERLGRTPCPYCNKESAVTVASTPTTTPTAKNSQGTH